MKLLVIVCLSFCQVLPLNIPAIQYGPLPTLVDNQSDTSTSIVKSFENLHGYLQNVTKHLLRGHYNNVNQKVNDVNQHFKGIADNSNQDTVQKCVSNKQLSEALEYEINEQIKRCATVVLAEYMNVITNSYNDVQVFMKFSSVVWGDIQECGLNDTCRWRIVLDAINEAGQIPPKVFSLTAKIQNLILKTITALDTCAVEGLKQVTRAGLDIAEEVFYCILDETNKNCHNTPTSFVPV